MDANNDITLTVFGSQSDTVVRDIKADNIDYDAITGNTYINLQPITNEPGWRMYQPHQQMPTTFTPQHNTAQPQLTWPDHLDFHWGPHTFAGLSSGRMEPPLLPTGCKRTNAGAASKNLPSIEELAMGFQIQQMPMVQQHVTSRTTPTPPPRSPAPRPRRPVFTANVSTIPMTRDASTDARDIHEHVASLRKANLMLQCCPDVFVDEGDRRPPQEDPQLYYLVIKNLRNNSPATRELVQLHIQKTANFAYFEFVQVDATNYSAFVGFRTIRHAKAVAKALPTRIALRNTEVCLANSRYILPAEQMYELMRYWTQRGNNNIPLHCLEEQ